MAKLNSSAVITVDYQYVGETLGTFRYAAIDATGAYFAVTGEKMPMGANIIYVRKANYDQPPKLIRGTFECIADEKSSK